MVGCKGTVCEYYRRRYEVQKHRDAYVPVFDSMDERCTHPKMIDLFNKQQLHVPDSIFGSPGIKLITMKQCPKNANKTK